MTTTPTTTMTCKQLGGPCDLELHGGDANEIIKGQDQHLRDAVATCSTDHEEALKAMKGRWRRPVSGMKWYRQVQRDRSEEHTSELQSLMRISYAVFCLKKNK